MNTRFWEFIKMTDKPWERYVSPRKRMAMGDKDPLNVGNYDVEPFSSGTVNGGGRTRGYLGDHERGAAPPIGGNQANPDHGRTD